MTFETFPYANYQDYNLDWIIGKIKELEAREPKDYDEIGRFITDGYFAIPEEV